MAQGFGKPTCYQLRFFEYSDSLPGTEVESREGLIRNLRDPVPPTCFAFSDGYFRLEQQVFRTSAVELPCIVEFCRSTKRDRPSWPVSDQVKFSPPAYYHSIFLSLSLTWTTDCLSVLWSRYICIYVYVYVLAFESKIAL